MPYPKDQLNDDTEVVAIVALANTPNAHHDIFTEESLRELSVKHANDGFWFDEDTKRLMWKGTISNGTSVRTLPANKSDVPIT